ncbi:hypothetical protein EVAR_6308_1 [Eumeta japonica]|uniref:Uncharacterized protein n=1 Tax=Eumeta variegata TaxID=151549 RepID=A0A4C1T9E6_EUMVA|nr:hypothetical protein EVAR_6308_1 [Eumeta japonica]
MLGWTVDVRNSCVPIEVIVIRRHSSGVNTIAPSTSLFLCDINPLYQYKGHFGIIEILSNSTGFLAIMISHASKSALLQERAL